MYKTLPVTLTASALSTGAAASAAAVRNEPLDAATLGAIIEVRQTDGIGQQPRFQGSAWHVLAIALDTMGG